MHDQQRWHPPPENRHRCPDPDHRIEIASTKEKPAIANSAARTAHCWRLVGNEPLPQPRVVPGVLNPESLPSILLIGNYCGRHFVALQFRKLWRREVYFDL